MPLNAKTFVCDHQSSNISEKMQFFYRDQLFCDIALTSKTDNLKVHAHRAVLSASSDYFRAILSSTLKEARAVVIELGIDGATLKAVVDFMYSGTIELRWENAARILAAADILKMSTLKVACSDFIGETMDDVTNCMSIAPMAKQQSPELHKKAFEFALQNFEEVSKEEEFLRLSEEQLIELISSDDLCVNSEETVFHSVVSWVNYDKGRREESMTGLLAHVRFSFLTPEFIIDNRQSLSKTYECLELLFSWLESHLSRTKLTKRHSERKKANGSERGTRHSERKKANAAERTTLGFVSGYNTDELKMQSLDPESNIWTCEDLPPSPTKRANYGAMVVDKKLIVAGGWHSNGGTTNIVECLDLQTKEWTNLPPMREERELPGMAELNGDLYVVGGRFDKNWLRSVEKYDFRAREWHELTPMHSVQEYVIVTVLGEQLYAVGDDSFPIESFNPADNKWTLLPNKNERSTSYGIAGVGRYLYAVGGIHNGQASKTVERYDPSTNTWTVISPGLGLALYNLRCVSWNNRLIACRGWDNRNIVQNPVAEYNPDENEWRTLAPLVEHDLNQFSCSLFTFAK